MRAAILVLLVALAGAPARAADVPRSLYAASTIVTGTAMGDRPDALMRCLRSVVAKLSGDWRAPEDPRIATDVPDPRSLVEDYVYLDRMTDIPTHDEQGTRERPFDFIVHFAPAKVDALMQRLGIPVWSGPRPPLVMMVAISRDPARFPLTADGVPDERMRRAALEAGERYGMRIVFFPTATLLAAPSADAVPMPPIEGAVLLKGTLMWSPREFGWVGTWHLWYGAEDHGWGITGVSFDEAFRDAVRGAARILAGRE